MNVERLDVQLVARGPAEAQDLGLQLLRRHAWPTFGAVLAVMTPIWILSLVAGSASALAGSLAIWWFKPVADRVALHVLSRAAFGATPTIRQTVAALPSMIDRPLLSLLTWRRLDPARALWLPVACLEGLRGKDLRERYGAVKYGNVGREASISTITFLHIEFALATAGFMLALSMLPEGWMPDAFALLTGDTAEAARYQWLTFATWLPGLLICEVAYTAAGFGLYVSRRTELEGWNVELAFQRLGARLASAARRGVAIALPLFACAALMARADATVLQEDGLDAWQPQAELTDPGEIARDVLSHPDFDTTIEQTVYRPAWDMDDGFGDGFAGFGELLAMILKALGWILAGAIVIAIVVFIARHTEIRAASRGPAAKPKPVEAFGLDLRKESLPDDIAGAARELAHRGEIVPCLSLLYRGALHRLVEGDELEIHPGDTEHDCIRRVAAAAARQEATPEAGPGHRARATYFEDLTRCWLEAAWGASPPAEAKAVSLCDGWDVHFAGRARAGRVSA